MAFRRSSASVGSWWQVCAQAAQFLLNGSLNAFLPLYASEVIGIGAAGLGWLFALQTVTTLATRPVIGAVSDRVGRRGLIVIGLIVCSAAVWLLSRAEAFDVLVAGVLAYAAGVAVTTAATSAYITDVAPRTRYGAAHGVFGTIYDVGDAAGPILAGLLCRRVGLCADVSGDGEPWRCRRLRLLCRSRVRPTSNVREVVSVKEYGNAKDSSD